MHRAVCLALLACVEARWKPAGVLQAKLASKSSTSLNVSTSSEHIFTGENHDGLGISIIALKEREAHVERFIKDLKFSSAARIQPAIRKLDLVEDTLVKAGELAFNTSLSMGEVACSLSHREVLKSFVQNESLSHIVVFEDDAIMAPGVLHSFQKAKSNWHLTPLDLLKELASTSKSLGWDGLNLGRCWSWCGLDKLETKFPGGIQIVDARSSLCTHAYIFTKRGAQVHLESTHPILDAEDRTRMKTQDFKYASTTPRIFLQQENDDGMAINVENDQPECV